MISFRQSPPMQFVLDTNIVLDWLVFNDSTLAPLGRCIKAGMLTLLSTAAALGELQRVLTYPTLRLSVATQAHVLNAYLHYVKLAATPPNFGPDQLQLPHGFPQCRDPDDQLFLALAFHSQAALISRDQAVLSLQRRSRRFGVAIVHLRQFVHRLSANALLC